MPEIVTLSTGWLTPAASEPSPGGRIMLMPAGDLWDAVRTSRAVGDPILERAKRDPGQSALLGPVLRDQTAGHLYWLIPTGSAAVWPQGVRLLARGASVAGPLTAFDQSARLVWSHLPDYPIYTSAGWLAKALRGEWT